MEAEQVHKGGFTLCPSGHKNARGLATCAICSLPLIEFKEELASAVQLIRSLTAVFSRSKEVVKFGLGGAGSKLLLNLVAGQANRVSSINFLAIGADEGDEKVFKDWLSEVHTEDETDRIYRTGLHRLKRSKDKGGGVWSSTLKSATKDKQLDDKIRRIGISESVEEQISIFFAPLGENITSGVGPLMLAKIKNINPDASGIVFAILPSEEDTDQTHFNAYCALSRFLKSDERLADILIVSQGDALRKMIGIDRSGRRLSSDILIPRIVDLIFGQNEVDLAEMVRLARSYRVQVFSPVYAYGRSYEIYDKIGNILDHAISFPLSPFDYDSVVLSIAIARVPEKIVDKVGEKRLQEQFNEWNRKRFPVLKGTSLKVVRVNENSDRIDVLLLLGGSSISDIIRPHKDPYKRFRAYIENLDLWGEFALTEDQLKKIQSGIDTYDKGMARLIRKTASAT
ncbi:MAG: hypothetical protein V3T23_13680 [Nitrososphaerales archaeon]